MSTQAQSRPRFSPSTIPSRTVDLEPMADSITRDILGCRDVLPKALNGHTIAPSNPKAAQFRKQMSGHVSNPVLQLATVMYTDLEDGVPFHIATAGLSRLLTFLRVHYNAMRRQAPRSIVAAFNQEVRAQHASDLTEFKVYREATCDDAALTACIAKCREHAAALEEVAVACEAELASRHSTRVFALKQLGGSES